MKIFLFALSLLLFGLGPGLTASVFANVKPITISKIDKRNELLHEQLVTANVDVNSPFVRKYRSIQKHINLQVEYPESIIDHKATYASGKIEFHKRYTSTIYGFRSVPEKKRARNILIVAGDSNTFGVGCNDDETLSAYLSDLLKDTQIVNMGLAGTAANSLLFFLSHFSLKDILPAVPGTTTMLYDFNPYLMERMIGGKNFIRWGWMQPSYDLQKNELVYTGIFNDLLITKFYKLINLIDPGNRLFPNLPQLHDHHFELVARIFLEVKKKFLQQTNPNNRFAVMMNPFTLNGKNISTVELLEKELHKLGIDTVRFNEKEALNHISIYPRDLHMTPQGQKYYAEIIAQEMAGKL